MSEPRLRITIVEELTGVAIRVPRRCIEVTQDGEVARYAVPATGSAVFEFELRRVGPTELVVGY